MKKLYDKDIREALINKLTNKSNIVMEELHIHNGNAIADVVSLNKEAHCYEIKSDVDNIRRIEKQGLFYDVTFNKITLVTTEKNLKMALEITPKHWGIMIAHQKKEVVILKYIRGTKYNRKFNKSISLKILWKEEMLALGYLKNKLMRRDELVQLIAKENTRKKILEKISSTLSLRATIKLNHTI